MPFSDRVCSLLDSMSLEQKTGQIFIFTWRHHQQAINDLKWHPGGYVRIYGNALGTARENLDIQKQTNVPLLLTADLERGIGGTINGALEVVTCMALGATGDEKMAFDAGAMIGREALAMGINMNYAPVLDVNSNAANPVINNRSFGSNPDFVARMGVAFSRGLQSAGVASCGKHFPGHGDSSVDSHSLLGVIDGSPERLERVELYPFRKAIESGIDGIMSAHLQLPAIDPELLPGTLSYKVMTTLLRDEMGFQGVAISDAMDMGAIAENYPPEISIPMAINAGCDQLIMPQDNERAVTVLRRAVEDGTVSTDRLNEAVGRILSLKEKYGILDRKNLPQPETLSTKVCVPEHIERCEEIARASITLVKNGDGLLPLKAEQKLLCLLFTTSTDSRAYYLEPRSFADHLGSHFDQVVRQDLGTSLLHADTLPSTILEQAHSSDVIVLAGYISIRLGSGTIGLPQEISDNLAPLFAVGKPVVFISFGNPYIITSLPGAQGLVCAYSGTQHSQKAAAQALAGISEFRGKLPVELEAQ